MDQLASQLNSKKNEDIRFYCDLGTDIHSIYIINITRISFFKKTYQTVAEIVWGGILCHLITSIDKLN